MDKRIQGMTDKRVQGLATSDGRSPRSGCGGGCGCQDCSEKKLPPSGLARRRFARQAVATSVLASLTSRPVWGGVACSVSGMMSGNLSGNRDQQYECNGNGCTPGFWRNNVAAWTCTQFSPGDCKQVNNSSGQCMEWDSSIAGGATSFAAAFGFDFPLAPNYSLLDVLLDHNLFGSEGAYYGHLVAALLNASCSPYAFGSYPEDIIKAGRAVLDGEVSYHDALATLDKMNNAGTCFLNANGECESGFERVVIEPYFGGICIPACPAGHRFDTERNQCVPE